MRNEKGKGQGIAVSIFVGIGLFFILPLILTPIFRQSAWVYLPVAMGCYFVAAVTLGIYWPVLNWRIGLWLFAPWPPALLFAEFLSADQPLNWKGDLLSLGVYVLMLIAACFGGWFGTLVDTRRTKRDYHPNNSSLHPRP